MAGERKQPSAYMMKMRELGYVLDDIWYRINGKSFEENYAEI